MFYKPTYFHISELVDKPTFDRFGEQAWMFFSPILLLSLDKVRQHFGAPVTANNWVDGGPFSQRGLRVNTNVGAEFSQHKFGNACDYDVAGYTAEEVRQEILKKKDHPDFEMINCIELGVTWVHQDCRNIQNRILLIKP